MSTKGIFAANCPAIPEGFFALAENVYRNDPNWFPEDRTKIEYLFSAQNQFFEKGHAWLGVEQGSRLAGFFHPENIIDDKRVAYFGYWETSDNAAQNQRLFADLKKWAASHQASEIYGPINFSTFMDYRIRIAPFREYKPFIGEPYNPTYYQALLEGLGYKLDQTYLTQELAPLEDFYAQGDAKKHALAAAEQEGFSIRPLSKDYFLSRMEPIYYVIDEIFSQNFAYRSIGLSDFTNILGTSFAKRLCPKTSFVMTKGEEIAGLYLTFPNYADLLRDPKLRVKASELSYEQHFKLLKEPQLLIKTSGVRPKYRAYGLHTAALVKCVEAMRSTGVYKSALGCLIRQGNLSGNFAKAFANNRYYGLFKISL
jgi:hypothetical protein